MLREYTSERGVSTVVSYAITLGIVTLLVSGLVFAGGSLVEDQRQQSIRGELDVFSQQLGSQLVGVDRLAVVGDSATTARFSLSFPERVTGRPYRIQVTDGTPGPSLVELRLSTESPPVTVTAEVWLRTDVADTTLPGGAVLVRYDGTVLEVTAA